MGGVLLSQPIGVKLQESSSNLKEKNQKIKNEGKFYNVLAITIEKENYRCIKNTKER